MLVDIYGGKKLIEESDFNLSQLSMLCGQKGPINSGASFHPCGSFRRISSLVLPETLDE